MAVGLASLAVLRSTQAADPPVDPALLEFLGSVDTEDKDWHDYLARTDIDQVARRAAVPPPAAPPVKPPVSSTAPPVTTAPVAHP